MSAYLDRSGLERVWSKIKAKFALINHTHDDRYYTESETDSKLANKANVNHSHSGYALSSHSHDERYYTESEVDTKLAGKSDTSHSHSEYAVISHTHDGRYVRYAGNKTVSYKYISGDDDYSLWDVTVPALAVGECASFTISFTHTFHNSIRDFKILGGGSYLIDFNKVFSGNVNIASQLGLEDNIKSKSFNYYRIS